MAALYNLYSKYQIKGSHSAWYHASINVLAKAFNKTLHTILEKMVDMNRRPARINFPKPYGPTEPLLEQLHRPRHICWSSMERLFLVRGATPIAKSCQPRGDDYRVRSQFAISVARSSWWLQAHSPAKSGAMSLPYVESIQQTSAISIFSEGDLVLAVSTSMIIDKKKKKIRT